MLDLPVEIWTLIFNDYLTVEDLISVKHVCKKFYSIIKSLKIDSLLYYDKFLPYCQKWFFTYKAIDLRYRLKIDKDNELFELKLDRLLFSKINRLFIFSTIFNFDFFRLINNFENLEQLELHQMTSSCERECNLILSNLRTLSITGNFNHHVNLYTALLKNLKITENIQKKITIYFPQTLKLFVIDMLDSDFVKKMKNLQLLYCNRIEEVNANDLLKSFSELRSIHFTSRRTILNELIYQKEQKRDQLEQNIVPDLTGYYSELDDSISFIGKITIKYQPFCYLYQN